MIDNFKTEELVTIEEILALPQFRKIGRLAFKRLQRQGLFPYVLLGPKKFLYNPEKVIAALKRRERPAKED